MAVHIAGAYVSGLRTEMSHGPSGATIRTAAPTDNRGDGSSFSPTDLVAAALASCMVTTMAIVAERDGITFRGAMFAVQKHMRQEPRQIDHLPVRIEMPAALSAEDRARLELAARTCPVWRTLGEHVRKTVEFVYPD